MTEWLSVDDALPMMLYTNEHPEPILFCSMPCVVQTSTEAYLLAIASILMTPPHIAKPEVQWHTVSNITAPIRQDITQIVKYFIPLPPTPTDD